MIAATAKVHKLTVVTRNVADFKPFKAGGLNPFLTQRGCRGERLGGGPTGRPQRSQRSYFTAQPPETGNTCPTKQSAAVLHR